jgi:hypothetical protein
VVERGNSSSAGISTTEEYIIVGVLATGAAILALLCLTRGRIRPIASKADDGGPITLEKDAIAAASEETKP